MRPNVTFICETCGMSCTRYQPPHKGKPRFCSRKCVGSSKNRAREASRFGVEHHAWKGDEATVRTGRSRALRMFKETKPCESCGAKQTERHHRDNNTRNNAKENIAFLCRACHMKEDGRLAALHEARRAS